MLILNGFVDTECSIEEQLRVLRDECQDLSRRREIQERQLETLENMALKARLESTLRRINDEHGDKTERVRIRVLKEKDLVYFNFNC